MFIGNYGEATDSLKSVSVAHYMDIGKFGEKTLEATKFNKYYFNSSMDLISFTSIVFERKMRISELLNSLKIVLKIIIL